MSVKTTDTQPSAGPTGPTAAVTERLGALRDGFRTAGSSMGFRLRAALKAGERLGEGLVTDRELTEAERTIAGQTATVVSIITLGVLLSVGILLYGEVSSALPNPESEDLQQAANQTDQQFADAMELAPVIMFVLIVGVVIGVVRNL
jgi:hypothetical protein